METFKQQQAAWQARQDASAAHVAAIRARQVATQAAWVARHHKIVRPGDGVTFFVPKEPQTW